MLWWIFTLGAVAWFPLVGTMAAYTLGYALLMYTVRLWSSSLWWAVAVGGWALFEFARSRFPLGGFPWGAVGFPIGTIPGARGAAQWIGPTGWGVLVIGFAAALGAAGRGRARPAPPRGHGGRHGHPFHPGPVPLSHGGGPGGAGGHRPGQLPLPAGALRRREAVDLRLPPRPDSHDRPGQRGPGGVARGLLRGLDQPHFQPRGGSTDGGRSGADRRLPACRRQPLGGAHGVGQLQHPLRSQRGHPGRVPQAPPGAVRGVRAVARPAQVRPPTGPGASRPPSRRRPGGVLA